RMLTDLIRHEHAPLTLAQRCSMVPAGTPLFTSLLNYRYSAAAAADDNDEKYTEVWAGITGLGGEERTNYPLAVSVDDVGDGFTL
ncbi:hypothetical protein, partial [Streptomyces sp. NRRL S-813]|uniref:hypothetical protein n=1 Tax=Streptomyces sp. NRRL S-813 TaxID=1463919 RepID=UPI000561C2E8